MSKLIVLLLIALFGGAALGKFTGSKFVTLPSNTWGAFLFYYSGQIVVGLDIHNGPTTGAAPSLAYYHTNGTLLSTYTLPFTCSLMSCTTHMSFISLSGNVLTVQVYPDALFAATYKFVSINLSTKTIVQQVNPPVKFYISDFLLPVNASTSIFTRPSSTNMLVGTLNLGTLVPSTPNPSNFPAVASQNTVVLSDMVYMCASQSATPTTFNFIRVLLPSLTVQTDTGLNCGKYAKYQSTRTQVPWITTHATDIKMQFYAVNATHHLNLQAATVNVATGAYATDFAVSANYAFAAGRLWANQTSSSIYQISTGTGTGTLKDSFLVPNGYIVGAFANSDYNSAVDETSMTYAVQATGAGPSALLILTFDSL